VSQSNAAAARVARCQQACGKSKARQPRIHVYTSRRLYCWRQAREEAFVIQRRKASRVDGAPPFAQCPHRRILEGSLYAIAIVEGGRCGKQRRLGGSEKRWKKGSESGAFAVKVCARSAAAMSKTGGGICYGVGAPNQGRRVQVRLSRDVHVAQKVCYSWGSQGQAEVVFFALPLLFAPWRRWKALAWRWRWGRA